MRQTGYIAITTTIVLSLMLLILAITLGSGSIFTRFGTADFYNKRSSFSLARSCLEVARLKLAKDDSYAGNETVYIEEAGNSCTIGAITSSGADKVIKARAQIGRATTNLKMTIKSSDLSTVTLEEEVK